MDYYSNQISRLIEAFSRLPGIGNKSAQRLAFHVINMPLDQVEALAGAIVDARKNVKYCKVCCTLTDQEVCPICSNSERDHKTIMVVETPRDLAAYEKNRRALQESLTAMGYRMASPDGAFYLFIQAPNGDDLAFSEMAKEKNLLLVPGTGFGCPGWFRICYCVSYDMIQRSLPVFQALMEACRS